MSRFRVRDVVDSTGAVLVRGGLDVELHGVSTDSRTLRPQQLYLALSGPNFDGNRFAADAARKGAGALVLRDVGGRSGSASAFVPGDPGAVDLDTLGIGDLGLGELDDVAVALHPTPRRALGDLAAWYRSQLDIPVIGITGSSGKTSTKDILVHLLKPLRRTLGSPASFNNDIGVPHTILLAEEDTEALILEIGTNGPGEIAALCRVARPTGGIITNIGASHLLGLGSEDGVAVEKADLFAALPKEGFGVLDLDGRYADVLRSAGPARMITTSIEGEGMINAQDLLFHAGGTTFRLDGHEVTSPLLGRHSVSNLLLALGAGMGMGFSLEELLPQVEGLEGAARRMEPVALDGVLVYDDSYNANPDSVRAGMRVLSGLHGHGRRVLVLGDMLELGAGEGELHHAIGEEAAGTEIDLCVFVGPLSKATAAGALEAGAAPGQVVHFETREEALAEVPGLIREGDVVLVKASRAMALDQLVETLKAERGVGGGKA